MANQTMTQSAGSDSLEALTEDRMRMWHGFTNATVWAVGFVVLVLVGMAIFLL